MLGLLLLLCSSILCFCQDANEVCDAVYYSTEGAQCTSGTACTEYKCEIDAATFVNFTFPCFNITRMVFVLSNQSTGVVSLHANNDSMAIHSFTNEKMVNVDNSSQCVTTLQVSLNASGTTITEITITRITQLTGNIMTSAPSSGCEEGKEESPCFTPAKPPESHNTKANTTLSTTPTPSSTNFRSTATATSGQVPQSIVSAILGASAAIGFLLLLIVLAILALICLLLLKKKKNNFLSTSELTRTENNYSVIDTQPTLPVRPSNLELHNDCNARFITARNPHDLSEFSLPVPPLEPELIPLEVWKRENDNSPLINPLYASTAASMGNLSEPPDYESIQDAKRDYLLLQGSLAPRCGLPLQSNTTSQVDWRERKEIIGGMPLLPEEESSLEGDSAMFTAENSIYVSEVAMQGYTAENFLYEAMQANLNPKNLGSSRTHGYLYGSENDMLLNTPGTTSSDDSEEVDANQSVDNQLYQLAQKDVVVPLHGSLSPIPPITHIPEPRPSAETHGNTNSPATQSADSTDERHSEDITSSKIPTYSRVDLEAKRHARQLACLESKKSDKQETSPCILQNCSDVENVEDPPCIPPYRPNYGDSGDDSNGHLANESTAYPGGEDESVPEGVSSACLGGATPPSMGERIEEEYASPTCAQGNSSKHIDSQPSVV